MKRAAVPVGFLVVTLTSEMLAGHHEPTLLPGDHPDTGAEWAYSPSLDRQPFAIGSNTRFVYANAGVARGVGLAFDPLIPGLREAVDDAA